MTQMIARALLLATTAMIGPSLACAAEAPSDNRVEELIVTAERREESLQRAPLAVTALSAAALENSNITSTGGLTTLAPALVMSQTVNASQPFIRGVGSQNTVSGTEASVATYVDGVYIAAVAGSIFGLNNIKQIEVLRGPQGTLFGRNATGGLIQITTNSPSQARELRFSGAYESYDTWTGNAYTAGAVTKDLAADLAVFAYDQGKGYGRNLTRGNEVNKRKEINARSKLLFTPNDDLKVTLAADYGWQDSDVGSTRAIYPGTVAVGGFRPTADPYDTASDGPPRGFQTQGGASLKIEYQLGDLTFTSLTASRDYLTKIDFDQDNTPVRLAQAYFHDSDTTWQQEFLLQSGHQKLEWTAGAIYFSDVSRLDVDFSSPVSAPTNFKLFGKTSIDSYAVFGQANYSVASGTRLTLGARYTHDTQRVNGGRKALAGNPQPAGTILLFRDDLEDKVGKVTWRVGLDHQFKDNLMGYASVSRGFKTGGYQVADVVSPPIKPEILTAYEAGVKLDAWERRLRVNLSAFHYDYKEIQTQQISAAGLVTIINAASASVDGGELETEFVPPVPVGDLRIRGTVALLRARYDSFPNGPIYTPNPGVCTPTPHVTGPPTGGNRLCVGDLAGNRLIKAPDQTASIALDYTIPVGTGEVEAHADYFVTSKFYFMADNRIKQPSYGVGNAQVAYRTADGTRVRLYVKNFTDEAFYVGGLSTTLLDYVILAPPRTFGIGVDRKF